MTPLLSVVIPAFPFTFPFLCSFFCTWAHVILLVKSVPLFTCIPYMLQDWRLGAEACGIGDKRRSQHAASSKRQRGGRVRRPPQNNVTTPGNWLLPPSAVALFTHHLSRHHPRREGRAPGRAGVDRDWGQYRLVMMTTRIILMMCGYAGLTATGCRLRLLNRDWTRQHHH